MIPHYVIDIPENIDFSSAKYSLEHHRLRRSRQDKTKQRQEDEAEAFLVVPENTQLINTF